MRDTSVDHRNELNFSFELSIQNMMCDVHDLNHFEFLTVAVEVFRFELDVLFYCAAAADMA